MFKKRKSGDENAELRIKVLQTENAALMAENAKLEAEYVQLNHKMFRLEQLVRKVDSDQQILLRRR